MTIATEKKLHDFVPPPRGEQMAHLCAYGYGGAECLKVEADHPASDPTDDAISRSEAVRRHVARGTPPTPLTIDDIRSVDAFRDWMIAKLDENIHKGNRAAWIDPVMFPQQEAIARLVEEVSELITLLTGSPDSRDVIRECADVANIAMMIADKTGELRTRRP